jgi:hypothetical protein
LDKIGASGNVLKPLWQVAFLPTTTIRRGFMQRRISMSMLALAGSAALVAGCGGSSGGSSPTPGGTGSNNSSQSPQQELTGAFSALGKASTLTTSLHLDTDASTISGIASSSGSKLTSDQANAIAGAKIAIEVSAPSGKTLSDLSSGGGATGAAVDFTVSDNGTNFLSVRSVNKTLYLQADAKDFLNTIGQGQTYAQLQQAGSQLPPFVSAALAGKWISLPQSAASSLTGGATSNGSSPNSQQEQAVLNALKQIITNDVQVSRTSTGDTDKLSVTANSKTIANDFVTAIQQAVPSAAAALGQADTSQVPDRNITLGAAVTGGALSQLSIDLGQFSPDPTKNHLPLVIDFAQGGAAITAPSGATPVDTQAIGQLFGGLSGGLGQ